MVVFCRRVLRMTFSVLLKGEEFKSGNVCVVQRLGKIDDVEVWILSM